MTAWPAWVLTLFRNAGDMSIDTACIAWARSAPRSSKKWSRVAASLPTVIPDRSNKRFEYRGDTHTFGPPGSVAVAAPNLTATACVSPQHRSPTRGPCNPAKPVLGTREPLGEPVVDPSVGIIGASAARPRGQAPWPAPAVGLAGAAETSHAVSCQAGGEVLVLPGPGVFVRTWGAPSSNGPDRLPTGRGRNGGPPAMGDRDATPR